MKTKNFLVLFLASALTFGLSSCGKDNENSPGPAAAVGVTNPIVTGSGISTCETSSSFDDFKNRVNQGRFVQELNNNETYYFVEMEPEVNSGEFLGFIPYNRVSWDQIGNFTRSGVKGTDQATHEAGNSKTAVRDYLMNILNQARQHRGGGTYYEVLTYSGHVFGIHLCLPLAANPVYRAETQTGRSYFYTGTGNFGNNTIFGFSSY